MITDRQFTLTAYEVRKFVQPSALLQHDPVAVLNEYLVGELGKAMVKNPVDMRIHLVSLYQYLTTVPEIH